MLTKSNISDLKLRKTSSKATKKLAVLFLIIAVGIYFIGTIGTVAITADSDLGKWLAIASDADIIDLLQNSPPTIKGQFSKLSNENQLKIFDASKDLTDKKRLWGILDDNDRQKLIESFESETDLNKKKQRYLELWSSLIETEITETEIGTIKTTTSPNVNFRNGLMKLLNKDQAQTLISVVTEKKVELSTDFDAQSFGYELKNNDYIFTLKKGEKNYVIPETNLPSNLETIELGQLKGSKSGYGVFYKEPNKRNIVLLNEEHYLQKSDNPNEWKVKNIDSGKPDILVGLDPTKGRVEIDKDGKIDIWGTGHLGEKGEKGGYVKIGEHKFFPSIISPQTPDKAYRYAFVKPLEDDVFNVKGNMIATVGDKTVGLYISDIENGVVSLNKIREEKLGENSISILKDTEGKLGLDIKGTAINGELSFSVSENAKLTMSGNTFSIESKKGEKFYTYGTTAKAGKLVRQVAGEKAEWVSRTDEVIQTTNNNQRVWPDQTSEGAISSHVSKKSRAVVNEADPRIPPGEVNYGAQRDTEESTTNLIPRTSQSGGPPSELEEKLFDFMSEKTLFERSFESARIKFERYPFDKEAFDNEFRGMALKVISEGSDDKYIYKLAIGETTPGNRFFSSYKYQRYRADGSENIGESGKITVFENRQPFVYSEIRKEGGIGIRGDPGIFKGYTFTDQLVSDLQKDPYWSQRIFGSNK